MDSDDMEPVPTIFEDLPNELLFRIIQKLDMKYLSNASLVSKRWYVIIDEWLGRKLFIGRQCQFVAQDEDRYKYSYVDPFEMTKIGIRECFVGEVVEPTRNMTLWSRFFSNIKKSIFSTDDAWPEFKYPHLLKTLRFDGPLPAAFFESILKNVFTVTRLEMHMTAFCKLNTSNVENLGKKFIHLKDLNIWGHKLTDGMFTEFYDHSNIIPNLLTLLLTSLFMELLYFGFEYPFDIRDDTSLTQTILNFFRRHTKLKIVRICINVPISADTSGLETFEDREWVRQAKTVSKLLSLQNLEIIISSMRRVRVTKIWLAFAEFQRNLESATLLSFRIPTQILFDFCNNNKNTLQKLFISRMLMTSENQPVQVDASTIAPCSNLTHLTLEGMLHSVSREGFTNAKLLPKSLVSLEIGGLQLLNNEVRDLFFELPNLDSICLTDIGNQSGFGLTVDTLEQVILRRRIGTVSVYRSICGEFPTTGIRNGDPKSRVLIGQRPSGILELKLNASGYYENKYGQVLLPETDIEDEEQ